MDKRYVGESHFRLIGILQKIPLFHNLTVEQFTQILSVSRIIALKNHQLLCAAGDDSFEMYILLSGCLSIRSPKGRTLSQIYPIGIVGEMGMFTGETRSATVEVDGNAIVLIVGRDELQSLFTKDSNLAIQIMSNVIRELAMKLAHNNIVIEELRHIARPDTLSISLDDIDTFDADE